MRKTLLILLSILLPLEGAWSQTLCERFADPPASARPHPLAVASEERLVTEPGKKLTWETRDVKGPGIRVLHFTDYSASREYEHVATLAIRLSGPTRVEDLSLVYEADGRIIWKVPEGSWRVYQFGASPSGKVAWAPDMFRTFRERRGYSLFPWLPVLAGEELCGPRATGQFLFDWRRTLAESLGEPYGRPDGIERKRSMEIPCSVVRPDLSGERSSLPMAQIRESASAAHLFGKALVAAGAFLGPKSYLYGPENMKFTADVALSCGLNLFAYDPSVHGDETWADEAQAWTDYLARSCFLLQQGRYQADVLYYYGEDNTVSGLFERSLPEIPDGYSYDFIHSGGLLRAVFPIDGNLVTESGMHYRMLVLGPACRALTLPVLERIVYLAESGVPVCGTFPEEAASLSDDQLSFDRLLRRLRPLFLEMPLSHALRQSGIEPDFIAPSGWAYVHRETDAEDIYWIRNFTGEKASSVILVRGGQGQPRILDPATGSCRAVHGYTSPDDYRYFQLDLEENDALFVVIGKRAERENPVPPAVREPLVTFEGLWKLSFESGRGAPATTFFDHLMSYTESAHPDIRHYAGTVRYSKEFELKKKQLRKVPFFEIDLGTVNSLARVTVNGHDAGVVWKAPFRVRIPADYLHPGTNVLEVKVENLWPNRLIGDLQPGSLKWAEAAGLDRSASDFYTASSPLFPAGLLGPVTLSAIQ